MAERKGEKAGWTWGWIGGFLWVAIVALVLVAQGKAMVATVGLLIFMAAIWATRHFAPWRHPTTPYWRLMAVEYVLFLLSAVWAVWAFGGFAAVGFDGWMLLWLVPIFIPILSNAGKTWADGEHDMTRRS